MSTCLYTELAPQTVFSYFYIVLLVLWFCNGTLCFIKKRLFYSSRLLSALGTRFFLKILSFFYPHLYSSDKEKENKPNIHGISKALQIGPVLSGNSYVLS